MPKAKPDGYHTLTPYITIKDAAAAIEFYKKAFGAKERLRMPAPDGKVGHAELEIGDSVIMLADEFPNMGCKSAATLGGSPVAYYLYVPDADAAHHRALAAGAALDRAVDTKFYGDRSGSVKDPYGYIWHLATHVEDVAPDELDRRMKAMMAKGECG